MVLAKRDYLVQVFSLVFISLNFYKMVAGKNVHNLQVSVPTEEEQARACYNFSVGNVVKQEFYSPNYPNNYPNNSDCVRVISAPYGHVVRVDFLDQFELEDSPTCEYDRLEIRNGPHSYSEHMNSYCGKRFPDIITTTDRHMWLKFSSDDSIEYSGFRAVYHFPPLGSPFPPETKECTFHMGGSAGIISRKDIPEETINYAKNYTMPIDCTWDLRVKPGHKVYLNFPEYKLGVPNNCDVNYVEIIEQGEKVNEQKILAKFCGTSTEPQKSRTNVVHVHFFLKDEGEAFKSNFAILYTAFREGDSCDPKTEFNCEDGTCIDKDLRCNNQNNCNYMYDEDPNMCQRKSSGGLILTSEHMIIILIVFFALVLGMCTSITISCYSKVKERRQREREVKLRRSKEASLEVGLDQSVSSLDRNLEAALAAQAAEICARRKVHNVRRGPQDPPDDESNGCYVPEVDLSVFRHYPNGGPDHVYQHHPYCEHNRRRDSEGSQSPPLPPPPPPPLCPHGNPRTFLPVCDDGSVPSQQPRFRAEAVIEMNTARARSYESTRSAPDVIVHR